MKIVTISKRAIIFILTALVAVSACACSGNSGSEPAVADIAKAITDKYPLSEAMTQVQGEDKIKNVYGIEPSDYSDIIAYVNNSGVEQDELVIVKAASQDKVDAIKEKLNNKITAKLNQTKNYLPEQYEMISKCEVADKGSYVRMIISPNADDMAGIFNAQFEK